MNFEAYVQSFERLYLEARGQTGVPPGKLMEVLPFRSQRILIVAPHPDDECLMAGFALRAQAEWGAEVGVLAFSHGSQKTRQAAREKELKAALAILNFNLIKPIPTSDQITNEDLSELRSDQILSALQGYLPDTVILPHLKDGHETHMRCARLSRDALRSHCQKNQISIHLLETEFWQSHPHPRFLIPLSNSEVTQMGRSLLCHAGEVARNPYHLTLPAWLMDQVRRGSEIEKGSAKGSAVFGQIYGYEEFSGQ